MIVLSHPTGNENVRQAALAFAEAGMLAEFWTTINWNPESALDRLLPRRSRETLRRRAYPEIVRTKIRARPLREMARLLLGNCPDIDAVSRDLDRAAAKSLRNGPHLIYAYEDCALESFKAAAALELPRIYDLPIAYWQVAQEIFAEEARREPEWAVTLTGTRDSAEKLARKTAELELATHVVVASSFTKMTLAKTADKNVSVISYGAPAVSENEIPVPAGKVKILFAGSLGQRKGISYALRAVEMLGENNCDFTLLGRKAAESCLPLERATKKYRWLPTLPHAEVLREMRAHDVVVFPSLCEGFGLVITEAMSQGTPVITTAHTAGPDIITDAVDGFLVPIRSAEAIAEKLEILARDRDRLRALKIAAREKARSLRWKDYRRRLVALAQEVMNNRQ